eukprot:1040070-Pelagomonas_calceolata.AAC.8
MVNAAIPALAARATELKREQYSEMKEKKGRVAQLHLPAGAAMLYEQKTLLINIDVFKVPCTGRKRRRVDEPHQCVAMPVDPVQLLVLCSGAELTRWYAQSMLLKLKLNPQQYGKAGAPPDFAPTPASLMREMLCRLGPAFVKIGQALSSISGYVAALLFAAPGRAFIALRVVPLRYTQLTVGTVSCTIQIEETV